MKKLDKPEPTDISTYSNQKIASSTLKVQQPFVDASDGNDKSITANDVVASSSKHGSKIESEVKGMSNSNSPRVVEMTATTSTPLAELTSKTPLASKSEREAKRA